MSLNYEQIEKVMILLDWRWWDIDRVPTIPEMKAHVENLRKMMHPDSQYIESGGFRIMRTKDDGIPGERVEFILTSSDVS